MKKIAIQSCIFLVVAYTVNRAGELLAQNLGVMKMNIKNWKQLRDYFSQNVKLDFPGARVEVPEWDFIRKGRKTIGIELYRGHPAPLVCVYLVGLSDGDGSAVLYVDMKDLHLMSGKRIGECEYEIRFPLWTLELASVSDIFSSKVIYQIQTTLQNWNQQALDLVAKYEADGYKMPKLRTGVPLISDIVR